MPLDFMQILNTKADETPIPDPLPVGTYRGVILKYKHEMTTPKDKSKQPAPAFTFFVRPIEPLDDVDAEAFANYGGKSALKNEEMEYNQIVTEKSLPYFMAFLTEKLGGSKSQTAQEILAEVQQREVTFQVSHAVGQRSQRPYAKIDNFLDYQG